MYNTAQGMSELDAHSTDSPLPLCHDLFENNSINNKVSNDFRQFRTFPIALFIAMRRGEVKIMVSLASRRTFHQIEHFAKGLGDQASSLGVTPKSILPPSGFDYKASLSRYQRKICFPKLIVSSRDVPLGEFLRNRVPSVLVLI